MPDKWCKRKGHHGCRYRYPKEIAAFTHMTEDGYMAYRRGAADIMVVPFNPWILLYVGSRLRVCLQNATCFNNLEAARYGCSPPPS